MKPNFEIMSKAELRAYVLKHKEDKIFNFEDTSSPFKSAEGFDSA